ncbi:MAG: hypothetical protein WCX73_01630 [Candidatus Pacearchaeota archaeon]|jgi:hypothetical protein
MEEKEHVLEVLSKVKTAIKNNDSAEIKNLSDNIIHECLINQDPDSIAIAVILYSLSKITERRSYHDYKNWNKFYKNYIFSIDKLIEYLKNNKIEEFRQEIEFLRRLIQKLSGNLKQHMQEVFRRAEINKASRIYEHGISMEKTASILGISVWELAEYAGKTGIGDVNLGITLPVKSRIKLAEEIFKK